MSAENVSVENPQLMSSDDNMRLSANLDQISSLSFFELIHRFDIDGSLQDCRQYKDGQLIYPKLGSFSINIGNHSLEEIEPQKHHLKGQLEIAGIRIHHSIDVLEKVIAQVAWTIGDRKTLSKCLMGRAAKII